MANFCNVDGRICPESEAVVPVLDRGFLFGDSVYEVIRTRHGNLFAWREHLDRLRESAAGIGMALSLDDAEILRRVVDTMRAAGNQEHYVRIVVTRGDGTAPSIDLRTAKGRERWIVFARALPPAPTDVRLQVIERLRNDRRALDPAVKSGNYLNNVLGLAEAQQQGATDCLFLNAQGFVTEASTSNLFVVRGGEWITPPLHAGILAGVTRALLLEWLRANGERATERDLVRDDVLSADAVFTSSTLRDVAPVTHVDGKPVGNAREIERVRNVGAKFTAHCDRRAASQDGPQALTLAGR
jgi:branched-chain amino acid aminotransferase